MLHWRYISSQIHTQAGRPTHTDAEIQTDMQDYRSQMEAQDKMLQMSLGRHQPTDLDKLSTADKAHAGGSCR